MPFARSNWPEAALTPWRMEWVADFVWSNVATDGYLRLCPRAVCLPPRKVYMTMGFPHIMLPCLTIQISHQTTSFSNISNSFYRLKIPCRSILYLQRHTHYPSPTNSNKPVKHINSPRPNHGPHQRSNHRRRRRLCNQQDLQET